MRKLIVGLLVATGACGDTVIDADALRSAYGSSDDAGREQDSGVTVGAVDDGGRDAVEDADPPACADFDSDGLCDSVDPCPVDAPNDPDGDGVCTSADRCPGDFLDDRDGDGVCDSLDTCPRDAHDDSDGDGVCDSDDPCPVNNPDDSDNDGACDARDACPLDALDDSDGDGSCDSADLCAGADDTLDDDIDGTPDACDACPGMSDEDLDANGYADACDQVLWSLVFENQFVYTIDSAEAVLSLKRGDGAYVSAVSPLQSTRQERSSPPEPLLVSIENADGSTPGTVSDVTSALAAYYAGKRTMGGVGVQFNNKYSSSTTYYTPTFSAEATIRRFVVMGFARADGLVDVEWQFRGYEPVK